jgi:hypothetical protein
MLETQRGLECPPASKTKTEIVPVRKDGETEEPISEKVPKWNTTIQENLAALATRLPDKLNNLLHTLDPLPKDLTFQELEAWLDRCWGTAALLGAGGDFLKWRAGEALCRFYDWFKDRKKQVREEGKRLKDEEWTWTKFLDAKGYARNTAGRYMHLYENYTLEDLLRSSLADLYNMKSLTVYEMDPPIQGELLRAEQSGVELRFGNTKKASVCPVGSCFEIVDAEDIKLPKVKILTGKKKGEIAQIGIERLRKMGHISKSDVVEPPPPPKKKKPASTINKAKGVKGIKVPQPKLKLVVDGCYKLTKDFAIPGGTEILPAGTYLALTHKISDGRWNFTVFAGLCNRSFVCKEDEILPALDSTTAYTVANQWTGGVPKWGSQEFQKAMELLFQLKAAWDAVKKPTDLEAALLNRYRQAISQKN